MTSVKIASHNYFAFENSLSNPARTDSFSSYLNFIRENFLPELENSAPERLSCQISLNRFRQKAANREIDVFDAEKYFSEKLDDDRREATKINPKKPPSSRDAKSRARKPPSAAGSTCSDSSSNMSQRTLLRDHSRRSSRGQRADASGRSRFLGVFPCPCAGKDAVGVVREAHPRGSSIDQRRDWTHASSGGDGRTMRDQRMRGVGLEWKDRTCAGFPQNWNNAVKPIEMELIQEEKLGVPKAGLQKGELFGLSAKKITVDRKEGVGGGVFNGRRDGNEEEDEDEDVASETSSDLFEIETISVNSQPFFSRQGTESTTGYEPSEASIEWSVATAAAAADFPPGSEFKDSGSSAHGASRPPRLQRQGLFMTCSNDKAVDVSNNSTYRKPERASFEGSAAAVARYRAESCGVMNVDASCNTARVISPAAFASGRTIGTRTRVPA